MINVDKLVKAGKDYAKKQMTPENLLKQASKYQGKQKNPNKPAQTGQTEAAPIEATATSSTVTKYLPYIVAAIAIVIVIFVMKKK